MAHSEIKKQGRIVLKFNSRVEKPKGTRATKKKTPQQAASAQNDSDSLLLRLPGEIWNQIYHYVIGGHEAVPIWTDDDCTIVELRAPLYNESGETKQGWAELFNLSYVCKKLNTETRTLPYKLTVFQVELGGVFGMFLKQLKEKKKQLITTISFGFKHHHSIDSSGYEEFTTPVELYGCSGLETVISRITLSAVQKRMVKRYAEDMGVNVIPENNHLGYIDDHEDEQMQAIYDEWEEEYEGEYDDEYEDEDEE